MDLDIEVCACSICRAPVTESQMKDGLIVDSFIYKAGELAYIELAHRSCAELTSGHSFTL